MSLGKIRENKKKKKIKGLSICFKLSYCYGFTSHQQLRSYRDGTSVSSLIERLEKPGIDITTFDFARRAEAYVVLFVRDKIMYRQ